jgi:hypothetical protein
MNAPRRIVICGTSIFVAAIESGLEAVGMGEVLVFDPRLSHALERISALDPSVVIIEKAGDSHELTQVLLDRSFPIVLLDEAQSKVMALPGNRVPDSGVFEAGMGELTQVIEKLSRDCLPEPKAVDREILPN